MTRAPRAVAEHDAEPTAEAEETPGARRLEFLIVTAVGVVLLGVAAFRWHERGIDWNLFFWPLGVGLVLGVVAGFWPATRAQLIAIYALAGVALLGFFFINIVTVPVLFCAGIMGTQIGNNLIYHNPAAQRKRAARKQRAAERERRTRMLGS